MIRLCPAENCKEGIVDMKMNPPQCRRCRRAFCPNCMMAHHTGSCDKNFNMHFREFRKCPQCGISIQKIDGCNHITCRCSFNFCFVCMSAWNNNHYSCREGGIMDMQREEFYEDIEEMRYCKSLCMFILYLLLMPFFFAFCLAVVIIVFVLCGAVGGFFALAVVQCFFLLYPCTFILVGIMAI